MSRSLTNFIYQSVCALCVFLSLLLLGSIAGLLALESSAFFADVGLQRLLTDSTWFPQSSGAGTFGSFQMLTSSLAISVLGTLVAAPVALALVVYQRFYASSAISRLVRGTLEVAGAIPSVVFGLVGLVVLVPLIQIIDGPGSSLAAGAIVVSLMILPTAALIYDAGFEGVEESLFLNCAALGISKHRLVFSVLLPSMFQVLVSGAMLALARALGETMAVLMVTGNVIQHPTDAFAPVRTLTANIALEMPYAMGTHRSALFACGLLIVVVAVSTALLSKIMFRFSRARR